VPHIIWSFSGNFSQYFSYQKTMVICSKNESAVYACDIYDKVEVRKPSSVVRTSLSCFIFPLFVVFLFFFSFFSPFEWKSLAGCYVVC
jgi:hypothetical protein